MDYRKQLKQYIDLQDEIKDLELRIKKLSAKKREVQSDTVVGSASEFPYNSMVYTITGFNEEAHQEKLERLNCILIKRKQRCEDLKLEIEEFISTIPDSKTRRVFTLRYIDGLTWLQIARRIERYDESYPRKMIHDKYLENEK